MPHIAATRGDQARKYGGRLGGALNLNRMLRYLLQGAGLKKQDSLDRVHWLRIYCA